MLCHRHGPYGTKRKTPQAPSNPLTLELKSQLIDTFQCTIERMTTPFAVHHTTSKYWTEHPEDAAFGANQGSLEIRWTDLSLVAPPCDVKQSQLTLAWALQSAQHTKQPTLAILALPIPPTSRKGNDTPYSPILQQHPGWCRRLMSIPRATICHKAPGTSPLQKPTLSKWGLIVVCVGNHAGYANFGPKESTNDEWMFLLTQKCTAHLEGQNGKEHKLARIECHPCDWAQPQTWGTKPLPRTKAFKKSRWEPSPPHAHKWKVPDLSETTPMEATPPPPLRYNWRNFYYTDGSAIAQEGKGTSISAAVYKPAADHNDMASSTTTNCTLTGGPRSEQTDRYLPNVNTINRAELVGIRAAYILANPGENQDINIATDSLTSMYQIHRMITHPQDMQEHRHHHLLTDIVHKLRTSQATLHLWKVTSHTGDIR